MSVLLDFVITASFWAAALRISTPYMYGIIGELICERAGVLNLGIEGIMTMGAMLAWLVVYSGGDLWTGVVMAALSGALFGLLHSIWTVRLGLPQPISGIAITLLASNLSYFIVQMFLPDITTPPKIEVFAPIHIPVLSDVPYIGSTLGGHTWYTYVGLSLVPFTWYLLFRTPMGLAIRMVGENPFAAEAQGINVYAVRTFAVVIGSTLMAVGGAFLTTAAFDAFYFGMVAGRGWISVALVVFASWRPGKALFTAIMFGTFDALQIRMQQRMGGVIPHQVFLMLPYLLCIVALLVMSRRADYPKALLVPYRKGEDGHQ